MLPFVRYEFTTLLLTTLAWSICAPAWAGVIKGTAAYRERIALPPDAVFEAVLQDSSKADAPATVLGRARINPAGQPPFRFQIPYDDAMVKPGRRYTVRAVVFHQGHLLFTSDRNYAVLDGSTTPLEIRLVSARSTPPVSDRPLRNTYWKLVSLADKPVEVIEKQREPHLILAANELRVSGSGGCNRIAGSFKLEQDKLSFGPMAGTMMACPTGMEQEQKFLQSLEKVERYRISGSQLEMLDPAGAVLSRYEAVALP
jgi:putative lipoprotein